LCGERFKTSITILERAYRRLDVSRMKVETKPTSLLYPCPVVLVTSSDGTGKPNIITLAWVGVVCSDPPMIGIAIRPGRYSYALIERRGEFVVNIPTKDLLNQTEYCGVISGRDVDKFSKSGLTPQPSSKVAPPLIRECPVNLECKVRKKIRLGSHDLFIGEVVSLHVEEDLLDSRGDVDFSKTGAMTYMHVGYWEIGNRLK
jgi:flavin reductase (DIM6/NTAB) family NADH-FMN oxidoreductase RutF